VEPYTIYLSNKKLAEMFLNSFPIEAFSPGNQLSTVLLTDINRIMPGFRPSGNETRERLSLKLVDVLRKFSPKGSGRIVSSWKEDHTTIDFNKLSASLRGAMETYTPQASEVANAVGGSRRLTRKMPNTRNTRRKRFTRRKRT
jgi:hypothetical protein